MTEVNQFNLRTLLFKNKPKQGTLENSGVYEQKYKTFVADYIGQSGRSIKTRIKEPIYHKTVCPQEFQSAALKTTIQ